MYNVNDFVKKKKKKLFAVDWRSCWIKNRIARNLETLLQLCGGRVIIKMSLSNHYTVLLALSCLMQSKSLA